MSEETENQPESGPENEQRCPHCDSVLPSGSMRCLMCGTEVVAGGLAEDPGPTAESGRTDEAPGADAASEAVDEPVFKDFRPDEVEREASITPGETDTSDHETLPEEQTSATTGTASDERVSDAGDVGADGDAVASQPDPSVDESSSARGRTLESTVPGKEGSNAGISNQLSAGRSPERRSLAVAVMTGVVLFVTVIVGYLVVRYGGPVNLALVPTATFIPPTPSSTPTVTLAPTDTPQPSPTPSITPEPSPTETPRPPRSHAVDSGETLFGLALTYNVSMESIANLNGFSMETPIQSGQTLQIPWPTATPPLEAIAVEINGETVVADPGNCERYQIEEGDAISVIAARYNINFELLQQVNRLDEQSILQPGDTICIPEISYGGILPPTPGPSPTPSPTSFPPGPRLLYPTDGTIVESSDRPVVLQWVAVKDLAPDEWYMVELTDLSEVGAHPRRGFTRQNAFRVPGSWRPEEDAYHDFQWRVSIVHVTGRREDGGFIYTFGGRNSAAGFFTWLGAIPTPTPSPTPTATSTPAPGG